MQLIRNNGFTLVELLITITIMAILTAIAWPQFTQQKAKAKRQECIAGLSGAIQAMEDGFNTYGKYDDAAMNNYKPGVSNSDVQQCQHRGYQTSAVATGPFATCSNVCSISVNVPVGADSYTLTATRNYDAKTPASDKDTDCNVFAVNNLGQKSATKLDGTSSGFTPTTTSAKQIKSTCWLEN